MAVILAGSSSNFLGSPTLATYTGAKAFSRVFSESLWAECEPMGIDVLHIVINFTDTPAMQRAGMDTAMAQPPDEVAQLSLDNMRNGPILILGGERGSTWRSSEAGSSIGPSWPGPSPRRGVRIFPVAKPEMGRAYRGPVAQSIMAFDDC